VFAPASLANFGPGFDIFGAALTNLGDYLHIREIDSHEVKILDIYGDNGQLTKDATLNTAGIAASETLNLLKTRVGCNTGVEIILGKKMPLQSGLGSSATSAVAAAYAVNELFGNVLKKEELVEPCLKAESAVSGYHADNVVASLFGGFIVIKQYNPVIVSKIASKLNLDIVIIKPDIDLRTSSSRLILPEKVNFNKSISNMGNAVSLVHALSIGDFELFCNSIKDVIVEPIRSLLIKGYESIKKLAFDNGALGGSICGAGPSIFFICESPIMADYIGRLVQDKWDKMNVKSNYFVTTVDQKGASIAKYEEVIR
jgi:homoserine kinase